MKNYYQTLGLNPNATKDEIKKAYRIYASKFHPDKQDGDKFFEERFREIQEAYEILSDDKKRKKYDFELNNYSATQHQSNQSKTNSFNNTTDKKNEQKNKEQKNPVKQKSIIILPFIYIGIILKFIIKGLNKFVNNFAKNYTISKPSGFREWLALTVLIFFLLGGLFFILNQAWFKINCLETEGQIVNVYSRMSRGRKGRTYTNYYAEYKFLINREYHYSKDNISSSLYFTLKKGNKTPVYYNKNNIDDNKIEFKNTFLAWLGIFIGIPGIFLFAFKRKYN